MLHRASTSPTARLLSMRIALMIATGAVGSMLAGCFMPDIGADELEPGQEPGSLYATDASVAGGDGGSGACAGATPLSSLRIRVRTTAVGGKYAPRNIGAIWIEDSAGKFVKTIELWAKTRVRYLTRWKTASANNVVDAVTGATLSAHTTHDRTWNLTGLDKCKVKPGNYRVVVEETDANTSGPTLEIPFTVGSATMLMPTESATYHDLLVDLK